MLPADTLPHTTLIPAHMNEADIRKEAERFQYPVILKLDKGEQGMCMRKVLTPQQVLDYRAQVPYDFLIQEFSPYPIEVSIFYVRMPHDDQGEITGFIQKIPMYAVGDGIHTIQYLIDQHPKGKNFKTELYLLHRDRLEDILPQGESYTLSYAGNHNRGALFVDLREKITPEILFYFDELSKKNKTFYYGRYDIKCATIEEFMNCKNFHILEFNGCGAEPNHFYDTGYTLVSAYKEILKHWKALYRISKFNAQNGLPPWPLLQGLRFILASRKELKMIEKLDHQVKLS
jgi:hypothetical protein